MTDGETRIWVARTVWEIRSSSRHFRIVLPGWSDKAISPAIFSRSGNSMGKRHKEAYISVSKTLSALDETPPWALDDGASRIAAGIADEGHPQNPYTRPKLTASPRRVRGVAWSILGGSGPLDSGSNPDGPISGRAHQAEFTRLRGTNVSCSFETESSSLVLALCRSRECRDPVERDRKV